MEKTKPNLCKVLNVDVNEEFQIDSFRIDNFNLVRGERYKIDEDGRWLRKINIKIESYTDSFWIQVTNGEILQEIIADPSLIIHPVTFQGCCASSNEYSDCSFDKNDVDLDTIPFDRGLPIDLTAWETWRLKHGEE